MFRQYPTFLCNAVPFSPPSHTARLLELQPRTPIPTPITPKCGRRYDDAAVTYLAAGAGRRALAAYRAGGRWRQLFSVAGQLGMAAEEVQVCVGRGGEGGCRYQPKLNQTRGRGGGEGRGFGVPEPNRNGSQ